MRPASTREKLLAAALLLSACLNFGMGSMLARWVREGVVTHDAPKDAQLWVEARDGYVWLEVRDQKNHPWFAGAYNRSDALKYAALVEQEAEKLAPINSDTARDWLWGEKPK